MRETALVTGASSGIGQAVAEALMEEGYEVYGIGRDFSTSSLSSGLFHPVVLDLLDTPKLLSFLESINDERLKIVVNNAGCAYYGLHETLNAEKISTILRTDLEVPEIIACTLLKTLRSSKGYIFNISSVTALSSAPHAACYGSAKAGLLSFSRSLYDENRKYGVKVVCLMPDLTESRLYRNADFTVSENRDECLQPSDISDMIVYILHLPEGVTIPEAEIRPQKNRIIRKDRRKGHEGGTE